MRHVGHLRQVALADGAKCPHARQPTLVERAHDELGELEPDAGCPLREGVGEPDKRPADQIVGGEVALADAVVQDEHAVEFR